MFYTMKINRIAILLVLGLVNIIAVSFNARSFSGLYALHKKGAYPNFRQCRMSDVRYCILKPIVRCSAGAALQVYI